MPDLTPINLSLKLVSASAAPMEATFAAFFKGDPGKQGPPGADGMPADVRANMSKLEGKHNLRDLSAALSAYHPSPTVTGDPQTIVGIGCWGDSVSPHVWSQILLLLFQSHQQAGYVQQTIMSVPGIDPPVTTGSVFDSGAAPVDQNVYNGAGGNADFTYLPGGDHYRLSNAATITISASANRGWATARAYLAKGPGMGSATVDLLDADNGDALLLTQTVDLADTQLGATKVQFTADPTKALKLRITATGTVVYLRGGFFRAYGLQPITFGRGGSTLAQQNYASTAITSYLMGDLNVKLMVVQAKEEDAETSVPLMFARFASLPPCSKLVVGSLPDNSDAATQIANNAIFRSQAFANDAAYFDGYSACKNFAELVRLGWGGDGTHPADEANRFVAGLILGELNWQHVFGSAEMRDVRATRMIGDLYISHPGGISKIIESYGGSNADKAKIENVAELHFGPEGSAPRLMQRSPNSIQILDSTGGTLGSFFVGNVEQAADNQQNYWAGNHIFDNVVQVRGYNVDELPGVGDRNVAFALDGRKAGEGAGAGTGVPVYRKDSVWYSFATDQPVQA